MVSIPITLITRCLVLVTAKAMAVPMQPLGLKPNACIRQRAIAPIPRIGPCHASRGFARAYPHGASSPE